LTNAPDSRKTHITRIFGTNRKGERLEHIWADLERMDVIKSAMQLPPTFSGVTDQNPKAIPQQWQGVQRRFRWCDDPFGDNYQPDGTPSRNLEILKLCDPKNTPDVSDPDEWIPVKVVKAIRAKVEGGGADGVNGMDRYLAFVTNDELQSSRVVEVRRVIHKDTNYDAIAQQAADADPLLKEYVIPSDDYRKDDDSSDDNQYVEYEVIKALKHSGNAQETSGINRQTRLLNQYLIDESEAPQGDVVGPGGINPPYRLDPFQNIVNINFGVDVIVVFVGQVVYAAQPPVILTVLDKKAEFLGSWRTPYQGAGFQPGFMSFAYKVSTSAGKFMQSTVPGLAASDWGMWMDVLVFAIDGTIEDSLQRAKEGTRLVVPATYLMGHDGSDLPADMAPPGLLWLVETGEQTMGTSLTWKMRYGAHRSDVAPNNSMAQCYPVGTRSYPIIIGGQPSTMTGYQIFAYRLDKKGTGTVYGKQHSASEEAIHPIAPQWNQAIGGPGLRQKGVPLVDPPPLISVDI
jgi:hypothetical protein